MMYIQRQNLFSKKDVKWRDLKIKKIQQTEKKIHQKHDQNKKISYNLFLTNQKNTRKELKFQIKSINSKWKARAKSLKKEFIKELKTQRD